MFAQPHLTALTDSAALGDLLDAPTIGANPLAAENAALKREIDQARQRHEHARRWMLRVRKYHRGHSHATTGRVIRGALEWFDASSQAIVLSLF